MERIKIKLDGKKIAEKLSEFFKERYPNQKVVIAPFESPFGTGMTVTVGSGSVSQCLQWEIGLSGAARIGFEQNQNTVYSIMRDEDGSEWVWGGKYIFLHPSLSEAYSGRGLETKQ